MGAEGLTASQPEKVRSAGDTDGFAEQCLLLLEPEGSRIPTTEAKLRTVSIQFSSEQVAKGVEEALAAALAPL